MGAIARTRPGDEEAVGVPERVADLRAYRSDAPVDLLLDIDREYRSAAREGKLRTIAPRRFNPYGEAWLPLLHVDRDGWSFTALFSNTERAHQLAKTHDWVVLHYERDGRARRCTVVTERRGQLAGLRVVRGREQACRRYYAHHRGERAA